jgi:hypothetical protein
MLRNLRYHALAGSAVALLAACGGDDGTGTSPAADGTMSALVADTLNWSATRSVVASFRNGELTIIGTERSGRYVKLDLYSVTMNPDTTGLEQRFVVSWSSAQAGFALYSEGPNDNFSTITTGGQGTIVITRLTATRAVGTFTFVGVRAVTTSSGPGLDDLTRRLSVGVFDVRLQ